MFQLRSLLVSLVLLVSFSVTGFAQKYNKYADSYNFRKALEAIEEGDFEKAESAFESEISNHSDNGYAHLWLAVIQYENEEYGKALGSINTALKYIHKKDKSNRSYCYYKRAGIYRALEKDDLALADYTMALSLDPEDDDSLWERAQIYYEQEKLDLAEADYKRMLELNPSRPGPYMGLGRNEMFRKEYQKALDLFDEVVSLYADYSSGYSFRAEAYVGLKKYMEAAGDIVKALSIDYDDKAFYLMQEVADSAFVQMNAKLKAMAVYDSNNSYWPYCLGVINEHTHKYADAIEHYKKSAKLDEDTISYQRISSCYESLGNWASAIEYMDKAITLDPQNHNLIQYKANIYYEAGEIETAISMMDEYVERRPDYGWGYYRRGWYKDNIHDIDGAIEDYTTSIALDGDYPYVFVSRGQMYLQKGDKDLAMKDFETVIQIDTVAENGSCTMYALMYLGRNEEAVEWMNKMLESSEDEGVYYEASCLYSLMGDTEKSLYYLEESLKRGNKSYNHIMTDDDIDSIRDLDAFKALMEKYFPQEVEQESSDEAIIEYTEKVVEVPFTRQGGVTQVKCTVNDLPLHFIFDTGAADVSISRVEATFMLKNEYLLPSDIVGKARYIDANGDISVGTVINIRKITFGGLELENVRASVVESDSAPLLLGQSVLNRLGKIEIDYDRSVLKITTKERVQ